MKKLIKPLFWPFIYLGMKIVFPKFKDKNYYTMRVLFLGLKQRFFGLNKHVSWPVHGSSVVLSPEKIIPGTKCPGIAIGCFIDGRNGIDIGENVWIGPRVSLISQNHDSDDYRNYINSPPIIIRKNSLLTCNSVILPGVELGEHTIVTANSVVRESFPEGNQILAGNPAKVVKKLGAYKGA